MMKLLQETDGAFYTDEKFKFMRHDAGSDEEFYVMVLDTLSRTGMSWTANAARDTDLLKRILKEYDVPKSYYETSATEDDDSDSVERIRKEGDELIQELESIDTGKTGGADKKFETFAWKLITYLFTESMTDPLYVKGQGRSLSGLDIKDWMLLNSTKHDYWIVHAFWDEIVKYEFETSVVVIECKNYEDETNQDPIVTTHKYLNKPAYWKFCILLTRKGLNKAWWTKIVDAYKWTEGQRTCTIVLDDKDVKSMIKMKQEGIQVETHLMQKYLELVSLV